MLVNDKCKLPNIGASKLNKSLISNWSNGLVYGICIISHLLLFFIFYWNIYTEKKLILNLKLLIIHKK